MVYFILDNDIRNFAFDYAYTAQYGFVLTSVGSRDLLCRLLQSVLPGGTIINSRRYIWGCIINIVKAGGRGTVRDPG